MKYKKIKIGKKLVPEHKIVVENFLGRVLTSEEKIHHINSIKTDNRIENLMLFNNQAEHKKFENQVRQFGWTEPLKKRVRKRWKDL